MCKHIVREFRKKKKRKKKHMLAWSLVPWQQKSKMSISCNNSNIKAILQPTETRHQNNVAYSSTGDLLISGQLVSSPTGQGGHLPHLTLPHCLPPHCVAGREKIKERLLIKSHSK